MRFISRAASGVLILGAIALFWSAHALDLSAEWQRRLRAAAILAVTIEVLRWSSTIVRSVSRKFAARPHISAQTATAVSALTFATQLVVYTIVLLFALAGLGVDITTLLAGLGVGGI